MAEVKKGDLLQAGANGPKIFKVKEIDKDDNVTLEEVRPNSEFPEDAPEAQKEVVQTTKAIIEQGESWVGVDNPKVA